MSFTGNADYNGPATLTVQTSDGSLTDTDTVAITVTPVADIVADTVAGTEDTTISFNVLTGTGGASADNFEGTPQVTGFTQPANGTVTVAANGNVVYTPNANYNGADTFTYTVTSGGVTETTTVTVNVAAVNDAPTQVLPPAQSGTEDTAVVFNGANGNQIILGDVDAGAIVTTTVSVPFGALTAIATPGVTITGNGSGSVVLSGSPSAVTAALNGLSFAPRADSNGSITMTVSTTDGVAAPITGTVAISLAAVADIQNDSVSTNEDTSAVISVLANDTFENPGRAVTSVTNGANGTVTINGNGTVTYVPNANFNGTDTFTYTVTSGGATETATVTVTVSPVNDPVTQTAPSSQAVVEDTTRVFSAATGNAIVVTDVDGDALTTTISATNGVVNLGSVSGVTVTGNGTGTVTLTGSASAINAALNGLTYRPTADFNGAAAMTVTTSDGATTATNAIALSVSAVADITNDAVSTSENTAVSFNVLANDTFENAGATVSSITQPANGTVTIGSGGQLTYTPNTSYLGSDTFTYTVTSGGVTETATVTVNINNVNDDVQTAVPPAQTTNEDTAVVFSNVNGNAIVVTDLDNDTISMTVSATNGLLTLGSTSGVTVSGNGTGTITVSGLPAALNTALNGLRFAPAADYNGAAVISVTASDGAATTSDTINVTINPVSDIVADSVTTNEDTPITFNALTNDTFENAGRTVTSVSQGSSGTVSFQSNGTMVYTPNANFHGVDTFTYTVTSNGTTETTTVTVNVTSVNDAPTTTGLPNRSSTDGAAVSIPVAGAFADVDTGDTLTYSATGLPAGLTINPATGVISGTIDRNASQSGPYTVTVTANDGHPGGTVSTAFTFNVSNPAPTANNDAVTVAEDAAPTNIAVLANDTDPDGDPLTVTSATAANGTVTIRPDGTINYQPAANFNGTDTISYQISDGNGGVSTATVTVTVTPVNDAPVAVNDTRTTSEGTPISVTAASGVLANDSDVDGDTLTVSAINGVTTNVGQPVAGSAGGLFTVNADGSYAFQPNGNFEDLGVGETRQTVVSYTVSDGNGGQAIANVTITVTGTNDAPTSTALAPASGVDGAPLSVSTAPAFSDVDGDTLSYSATGLPAGLSINPATGIISGTLNRAASQGGTGGVYSVVVTANDGFGGTVSSTLTLTVTNPAPIANNDAASAIEDTPATGNVLANDTDPDGDPLAVTDFSVAGVPGTFTAGNTATIPGVGTITINAAGGYTFTPAANYNGAVPQITYTISDGNGGTDTATLDLGPVAPRNDAPTSTPLSAQSSADSSTISLNVAPNFSDIDGDTLTYSATGLPPGLSINPATGVVSGTIDHLASSAGSYSVTVRATDPSGASTQRTFSWTVTNPAPTGAPISNATGTDGTPVNMPVAGGFSDPDGDTLTYSASGLPSGLSINPASGVITGTLSAGASAGGPSSNGVYTIAVTATDSQGALVTRTFTYTVSNPPPSAVADTFTGTEDVALSGNVATNDSDPDGDALTFSVVSGPASGTLVFNTNGTFTYTPNANTNSNSGPDTFTYRVTDANGASATAVVTLVMTPVNDAPVAANVATATPEDTPLNGTLTATDVDGDALTFTKATDPAHGTVLVNADGTYVYTPAANYNGPDSFTFRVTDGNGGTVTRTVTMSVTPVNDAPVADNETASTPEDTALNVPAASGLLVGDTDIDGDALSITQFTVAGDATVYSAGSTATIASVGTLRINANGSYVFTPAPNYNGPVPVATYTVGDGNGGSDTGTLTLAVTPVNDAPTAPNVSVTVAENTPFNDTLTGSDIDGDTLTFTKASDPGHGTVVVNPNGTYTYTPTTGYDGPDSFTFTVSDGNGGSVTRTVSITIVGVNDAPIAVDDVFSGNEDTVIGGDVTPGTPGQDRDIEGDPITVVDADGNATNGISPVSGPTHGTLVLNADGTFAYTPNANYNGTDSFTYRISDGQGGFAEATVNLTINPVNDAPVAANDSATTPEDTPYAGTLPPASDVDGDAVTYVKASDPAHGTVVVNADGTYVYTPASNYNGTDTFRYSVRDTTGAVTTYTVTVIVTPVNDDPVVATIVAPPSRDSDPISFDVSRFVTDVDGDHPTYAASGLPPGLTINPATGVISGTLTRDASQGGPYAVTVTVNDGHGGVVTTSFPWPVSNPAPIARNDAAFVNPGAQVTVAVLANDRDPDGDPLTVTNALAANGSVQILADGSIRYTPADGFTGTDRITYVIDDGNGGTAIATVVITVADDTYNEKPPKFGFNGPEDPDAIEVTPRDMPALPSISADGAVLDAVFDIGLLRSIAGQIGANGAVLAAANGVRDLDGIASINDSGMVVETIRVERARDIMWQAGFDREFQEYEIEGLPGFSLRNNVPGNLGGLSAREQVVIESLVRQETLIIQISNTVEAGVKRIVDYRISQIDGTPLPGWLNRAAKDLLIGRREAGVEYIDLKVEAVYSDQSVVVENVRIETATGEIKPLKTADSGTPAPRLFGDQFHAPSQLTPDEIDGLGRAIGR